MRYALRKDLNQTAIVDCLLKGGASVYALHVPVDLLVGIRGKTYLVEIKNKKTQYGKKGLNENQKTAIKAQASVKVLDTQYKIDDFWGTRDLRDVKVELNESTEPIVINESAKYESPAGYMETVESELKRRFKR